MYISLSNSKFFEHVCLEDINKLYKIEGKFDDQQQCKAMIETALVSTPEWCNDKIPITPNDSNISQSSFSPKNKYARKSLKTNSNTLGFKPKTAVRRLCDSKHKPLAIKSGNELWSHVKTLRGRTLIIDAVKKALHKLIVNHPSVIKPPIARDCLQIKIYGQTKKQTMPRLLFQTSILELNNSMVISYTNVGLKDSIDKENNIIISDSILRNILPPQLKNMTSRYKIMFGCKYCMSDKSMHLLFLSWCERFLKKLKDQRYNAQNRRSSEISNIVYVTYKIIFCHVVNICFKLHQIW